MTTELLLPKRGIEALELPSYIKLDMAFALGEGTTLGDKSRYRSHGTILGADWATGLHGKCLNFDKSVPDYVTIPAADCTQLDFTTQDFSVIVRVNVDVLTANPTLFHRGEALVGGWRFIVLADGRLDFTTYRTGGGQSTRSAIGNVTTGAWFTLGVSRTGVVAKVYKNGVDVTVISGTHTTPISSSEDALIGIDFVGALLLDGKIEFLRIFGGIALPASTHLAYHNALA